MLSDMSPKKTKVDKKPKSGKSTTFRASLITVLQMLDLQKKWGENPTQVLTRAVQQAWERECGDKK